MSALILPTPREVKQVLTTLEPEQFSRVVRVVMGLRTREDLSRPLGAYDQLKLYLYEWLVHLGFLTEDQVRWLMGQTGPELTKWAAWVEKEFKNWPLVKPPVFTVTVTDRRYAMWPGQTLWADLHGEEFTRELQEPGCTHIVCDLFAVFRVKQSWLKRLQGGKDAGHQHHGADLPAAATAEPGGGEEDPDG